MFSQRSTVHVADEQRSGHLSARLLYQVIERTGDNLSTAVAAAASGIPEQAFASTDLNDRICRALVYPRARRLTPVQTAVAGCTSPLCRGVQTAPWSTTAAKVERHSAGLSPPHYSTRAPRIKQQSDQPTNQPTYKSFFIPTMVNVVSVFTVALAAVAAVASGASMRSEAAPMPTGSWPASKGTVYLKEPYTVKKGQTFDGGMKTYARSNVKCGGQKESGWQTAVFMVEPGATLKNVIIGKDQMEGVHCEQSGCTIQNVWWEDVCEDALSIKGGSAGSVTKVIGGGARSADDKVIQHNGLGSVQIEGFYAQDFGKLYRSCGTCGGKSRKVSLKNVLAVNGKVSLVTVNKNWGDQATIENIKIKGKKVDVCAWSQGSTSGEPGKLGAGPSGSLCQYSTSTISYA